MWIILPIRVLFLYPLNNIYMKKRLYIIIIATISSLYGFTQNSINRTNSQLALKYYNQKDYEKAAPLFKELFDVSRNKYYFRYYFICLLELKDYDTAEKVVKREIRKSNSSVPDYYIHWGHLLKIQKNIVEALEKYGKAIKLIPENRAAYINAANTFLQWGEFEMAQEVYERGRQKLKDQEFNYELARVYLYLRNYDRMMEEYLNFIRESEKNLNRVQANLSSAMYRDATNSLRERFKKIILKRIQDEPQVIAYNRLLIWFFLQERKFSGALRQAIAIDRRTGGEDAQIADLAKMALNNKDYTEARNAYAYLLGKGKKNPFYVQSYVQNLHCSYLYFIQEESQNAALAEDLAQKFKTGIKYLGYTPLISQLLIEYAHILAFYMDRPGDAIDILNKGLSIKNLKHQDIGELKTKMADVYVYDDDLWEALLIYSQVIDAHKNDALGDEVKLRKARLGYYLGNFKWAQAQLDVLKASTSKLTSNDAFELSLLISNNMDLDTTDIPLQLFAKADLLFFRNKDSLALATLDTIQEKYPYHSLVDDILFREAKLDVKNNKYVDAAQKLGQVIADFSFGGLGDDALFLLAEINQYYLHKPEEAQKLYKLVLVDYPGSIYVVESRKRFRQLRGDKFEEEEPVEAPDLEYLFFEGLDLK